MLVAKIKAVETQENSLRHRGDIGLYLHACTKLGQLNKYLSQNDLFLKIFIWDHMHMIYYIESRPYVFEGNSDLYLYTYK